jgi:hypothetical protein
MKIHAVEHVDDVLKNALALEDPEKLFIEPSVAVDWREERRPLAKGAHSEAQAETVPH